MLEVLSMVGLMNKIYVIEINVVKLVNIFCFIFVFNCLSLKYEFIFFFMFCFFKI